MLDWNFFVELLKNMDGKTFLERTCLYSESLSTVAMDNTLRTANDVYSTTVEHGIFSLYADRIGNMPVNMPSLELNSSPEDIYLTTTCANAGSTNTCCGSKFES